MWRRGLLELALGLTVLLASCPGDGADAESPKEARTSRAKRRGQGGGGGGGHDALKGHYTGLTTALKIQ